MEWTKTIHPDFSLLPYNRVYRMQKFFVRGLVLLLLAVCNCSIPLEINKSEIEHWRRNQDITNVDPGNGIKEKEIVVCGGYQCSIKKPGVRQFDDTTVNTENLQTITAYISSRFYETRNCGNFEMAYGIKDGLSVGTTAEISFGSVKDKLHELNKPTCDMGFYLRMNTEGKHGVIGFKPELVLSTINGEKIIAQDYLDSTKGNVHYLYITERSTIFGRYKIENILNIFCGIQQKRVMYMETEKKMLFENVVSSYFGISKEIKEFEPMIYVGIPIYSDYTNTTSPLQIGIKTNIRISGINH